MKAAQHAGVVGEYLHGFLDELVRFGHVGSVDQHVHEVAAHQPHPQHHSCHANTVRREAPGRTTPGKGTRKLVSSFGRSMACGCGAACIQAPYRGRHMSSFLSNLLHVPAPLAAGLIFLLVFGEAAVFIGFVLPGETAVVLGGVLASQGRLALGLLLPLVVVAAVLGDTVGYEVGKHLGSRVLRWSLLRRHQGKIERAQQLLRQRGGTAVFLARFTAFLRAVMPGLAGLSGMRYLKFLAFNAAGGLVWGVGFCLLGYFAGASYAKVESAVGQVSALVLVAIVVIALFVWHRRRRAAQSADEDASAATVSAPAASTDG